MYGYAYISHMRVLTNVFTIIQYKFGLCYFIRKNITKKTSTKNNLKKQIKNKITLPYLLL